MKKHLFFCCAAALLALSVFAGCSNDPAPSAVSSEPQSTVVVSSETPSQDGPSDFDSVFDQNPIDLDHQEARNNAMSTMDMLEVEGRYAEVWRKEIESAYQKLLDAAPAEDQGAIEREQEAWSTGLSAELDKIAGQAQNNAGTMASVQAAVSTQELYRNRAKELYRSLYRYNPDFEYLYISN